MALEWKTIPYSDEVAPAAHDHTGADITSAVANATDADTLDGEHASAFADATHDHGIDYAPISHTHVEADITDLAHDAVSLQGNAVSATAPTDGNAFLWNATAEQWEPGVIAAAPTAHTHAEADITDLAHDAVSLQGNAVSAAAPADGNAFLWNATADQWEPGAVETVPAAHTHAGADITSAVANATDADTLDGEHASAFADAAHAHALDYAPITHGHAGDDITSAVANATDADTLDGEHASAFADAAHAHASDYAPITHAHAGADITSAVANATDADTLDGEHASAFAATEHTHVEADITDLSHNAASIQGYGVSTAAPQDGDTFVFNALAALWTPGESTGTGGGGTLASLLDVGITATPDDNQVLAFKTGAGQWRAMSLPAPPSTARVREFDFQAEYPGAIIDPATLGDGLLEAFADAGHNAYEWTVISTLEQSAYIYLRWRLPPGFVSFAGSLKVTSKVSNAAKNCGVEVLGLYDATEANAIAYVTFKNADWTENSINLVAGTFAAGDTVLAKLRIFGQDTSVTYLAGIRIQYNGD